MILLGETPGFLEPLLERLATLSERLTGAIDLPPQLVEWLPNTVCAGLTQGHICLIRRGLVHLGLDRNAASGAKYATPIAANSQLRTVLVLQPGDWMGLATLPTTPRLSHFCEDPTSLHCYPREQLLQHLLSDPSRANLWTDYLLTLNQLFLLAYGHQIKDQIRPTAGFSRFTVGATIIQQGDPAEHVYTLMRGQAAVFVDDRRVGAVYEGEIFGAIAALTNSPRNATVVAEAECTVMTVPKEQFIGLMQTQPQTCMALMQAMARKVNSLNQWVVRQGRDQLKQTDIDDGLSMDCEGL